MPPKRKRPERPGESGPSRPSPHRPADTSLGQHDRGYDGGRGNRGRNQRRPDRRDSNQSFHNGPPPSTAPPGPISPTIPRPSSSSSSAPVQAMNAQVAPTPAPPAPPSPPLSPIQPGYLYDIVTDDRIERWTQGARQELIDHGVGSREDEDVMEITTIFEELLHSVAGGRLPGADAGKVAQEILGPDTAGTDRTTLAFDPHMLFLDTVSAFMDVESDSYRSQLGEFMKASGVSPALMRTVLDPTILQRLDLIRDTFSRMGVRHATNMLYRQANYNLLREETEGYSKLSTELFTTSSTEPPNSEVVQAAFHRVMGLIGTFDLHPGRVLDVTLDIFAAVLIKQFRFFVKFLRVSSWWPRNQAKTTPGVFAGGLPIWALPDHFYWFTNEEEESEAAEQRLKRDTAFWDRARQIKLDAWFELGGRQLTAADEERFANDVASAETSIEEEWMKVTKTLPPIGNRDAAQMLGFKLRFYANEARDPEDVLPANLLYLISLLVKIGFVSLTDIWNHVWPDDDENMNKVREKIAKEVEEKEKALRPGETQNALLTAGVLSDDPPPPGTRREAAQSKPEAEAKAEAVEEKPRLPDPDDQKVHLLRCLLTIGAIPESLFILGRHDWMLEECPDLPPLMFRILHHALEVVWQQSRPVAKRSCDTPAKAIPDPDQSGVPKGSIKLSSPPSRRALRWPFPDKSDLSEGAPYRFYWDEWADNIPVCQTVDDVFTLCDTLVNTVGVRIGKDPSLVGKLTMIGAKSLAEDQSADNKARWLDLLKRLLVPCLSLSDHNSTVVEQVWTLLKQYPIHVRYNLYAEWYEGSISRIPAIRKAFASTRTQTLAKMKRLSLTNLSEMAKSLAKIAYPSPGILCKAALLQIESYTNLIDAFVKCVEYFTELGYDVLVWSVLSSIGGQRSRTQADSVLLTSKWLQALSKFSGKVFQRYPNMDPTPILRYVNDQLFKGNSTDLLILRELIQSMGGVVSDLDFTDVQLRAMTAGPLLRSETLLNVGDRRANSVQSAARLIKSLVGTKLAGQLLINIAQYRQNVIYRITDSGAHVKYMSTVLDDTHQILRQYLDLLRSNLDGDTFDSLVPDIAHLMKDYGLQTGLAFMIGRASLRQDLNPNKLLEDSQPAAQPSKLETDTDGDVSMGMTGGGADSKADESDEKGETDSKTVNNLKGDPLLAMLQPLIDEISNVLPGQSWKYISPIGYVFFWALQLGDLAYPQECYDGEHQRLMKQAEEVMKDRSDMTRAGMNRKTRKRDEMYDRQKRLLEEAKREIERCSKLRLRLNKHVSTWFPADLSRVDATSDALLTECILPRLSLSPVDAEYCFKFIKYLHEFSTPNFKLMSFYNRLFNQNRLRTIIFNLTVREAENFGRFLSCVFADLNNWHWKESVYESQGLGLKSSPSPPRRHFIGFATALDDEGLPTEFIEHAPFKELHFQWHKEINVAFRSCLNSMEWMHIRNAITILKSVVDYYPAITFQGEKFIEQLKTITDREAASKTASESETGHRVDLSVAAQTAYSALQKRKKKWVIIQQFRPGQPNDAKDEQRPAPTGSTTLRASAPEFKPGARKSTANEVEDGEVKDNKGAKVTNGSSDTKSQSNTRHSLPSREPAKESSEPAQASTTTSSLAKPPVPKPPVSVSSGPGVRTESGRYSTLPPGGPNLPSRPDVTYLGRTVNNVPERFNQSRHERREPQPRDAPRDAPRDSRDYRDSRDARDPRDARELHARDGRDSLNPREGGRDYRAPDNARPERPRDFAPPDRRQPEPNPRDSGRPDRDWPRGAEPPPRWNDHGPDRDMRQSRDRPPHGPSRDEPRPPREHAAATPPAPKNELSEPPVNPDRSRRMPDMDRSDMINPARAARMSDTREPPRSSSSSRDQARERPPRTDSPRRTEHPAPNQPDGREDRHSRHRHSDYHSSGREGHADSQSSQPRQDRNSDREPERPSSFRDSHSSHNGPPSRGADQDHSRLSQQDPNYGRLNNIPTVGDMPPGPPSGPRGRGRNTARMAPSSAHPAPPGDRFARPEPIRPPTPERHPPTGPSSSRPRRGQYDGNNSGVNSPTSAGPSPAVGAHPDSLRSINPPTAPAIHPDRLKHIGPAASPGPPLNTPDRPSASHSHSQSNSVSRPSPLNTEYSTPTGPAASNDRMRPRQNRQLQGIQSTLEKASADNGRGPGSFRMGSRPRQNLANSDAQILAGASPVTTPVHERHDPMRPMHDRPEPVREPLRQDSSSDRPPRRPEPIQVVNDSRDDRGSRNGDEQGSSRDHERSSRRDHHRSDRSNRNSRRNSRERSPDREREGKEPRDYRDRRVDQSGSAPGGGRESERDATGSRRSMRDSTGGRDSLPGTRDMGPPRESSHRGHRGDGPPGSRGETMPSGRSEGHGGRSDSVGGRGGEGYGNGNRSSMSRSSGAPRDSRSRPGDDRSDPRHGGDDRSRKRRSEGPVEPPNNHQDKRLRH